MSQDIKTLKLKKFHLGYLFLWSQSPLVPSEKRVRTKFLELVRPEALGVDEDKRTIQEKYCDKDAEGKFVIADDKFQFAKMSDEDKKKFAEELDALLNAEASFDILPSMTGAVVFMRSYIEKPKDMEGNELIFGNTPEDVLADIAWNGIMDAFDEALK
jgi:hypothetical protein